MDVWQAAALFQVVGFVVAVVVCCLCYSPEGDRLLVMKRRESPREVRSRYASQAAVADRLFELSVYRSHEVLWPFTMLCALSVSYMLLYSLDRLSLSSYFLMTPALFLAFDMPRRFTHAHRLASIDGEASLLIARFHELETQPHVRPPPLKA